MTSNDFLLPFILEKSAIRGRLVRLSRSIDQILRQHDYPDNVAEVVGQAVALAANLGTALKFDGVFTLQTKGDGLINLLVTDVTSDGALRSYARIDPEQSKEDMPLLGAGNLVFTVDQKETEERYQGIVELVEGDGLCESLQTYFKNSEQIPTGLLAYAKKDDAGHWRAACLMLQRMPRDGGEVVPSDTLIEDDWLRSMMLMQTCTEQEILDYALSAEDLLFRLFHEEGVRVFDKKGFRHECRCNHERIVAMLKPMPKAEIESMLEDGKATVTCQFCSKCYNFTRDQLT